jgi:prepilin-type processing-associated H-X9-DG protein
MESRPGGLQFRLGDMFAVILIFGILLAMFLPSVRSAREASRRLRCQSHMKMLGLGAQNYCDTFGGFLPANYGPATTEVDDGNSFLLSLLPFLENGLIAQPIFDRRASDEGVGLELVMAETYQMSPAVALPSDRDRPRFGQLAKPAIPQVVIRTFLCPSTTPNGDGLMSHRQGWQGKVAGLDSKTLLAVTCYKGVSGSNWGQELYEDGVRDMPGLKTCPMRPATCEQYPEKLQQWILPDGTDVSCVGHDYGDGPFPRNAHGQPVKYLSFADVTDGTSRTFGIGEVVPAWCDWSWWYGWNGSTGTCALPMNHRLGYNRAATGFHDVLAESGGFHSVHPGGAQFAMLDGSVQFVVDRIDHNIYRAVASYAGGEASNLSY